MIRQHLFDKRAPADPMFRWRGGDVSQKPAHASWVCFLIVWLPMGALQTSQEADHAGVVCKEIARQVRQLSGLEVKVSNGVVRDHKAGTTHEGCRVVGTAQGLEYRDNAWPHERLRKRLTSDKWREDLNRAADGAGSTAFGLRKGALLCLFSVVWNTHDPAESETLTATSYKLEVGCFESGGV